MRKLLLPVAVAVAALGLGPGNAKAVGTCPNVFNVCVDFTLTDLGSGNWSLATDYTSGGGVLTATGVYYNVSNSPPNFGISNVSLFSVPAGYNWAIGCNGLAFNNGSTAQLSACSSASPSVAQNGLPSGAGPVVIHFSANSTFASAWTNGELDFRGHVQSYGPTSCSIKVDTGVQGSIGTAGTDCVPPNTVPEPVTATLIASGLLGLGALRRRRRGVDVANG